MTQTIRNITVNTDSGISVDIYSHPNNSQASFEDAKSRYKYTAHATLFTQDDLSNWVKNAVDFDNEHSVDELKELVELFAKTEGEPIWYCYAVNGHDDYLEFYATREDAEHSLLSQTC